MTVFAAASLTDVLTMLVDAWPGSAGTQVRIATASSSTLARQIEAGAPADLFLSADRLWMDHLDAAGLLAPATGRVLAGNALVIIAAETASIPAGAATCCTHTRRWRQTSALPWHSLIAEKRPLESFTPPTSS